MSTCESCGFELTTTTHTVKDGPDLDPSQWTPGQQIELCEGCAIFARSYLGRFDVAVWPVR